jgi:hypothetical protein
MITIITTAYNCNVGLFNPGGMFGLSSYGSYVNHYSFDHHHHHFVSQHQHRFGQLNHNFNNDHRVDVRFGQSGRRYIIL